MSNITDILTEIQDLQSKANTLATYISGLESSNSTLTQQLAAANAKIAELQAQINPPVPPKSTVFSIDIAGFGTSEGLPQLLAEHKTIYGPKLPYIRLYSPTTPMQWNSDIAKAVTPADIPVFSFKQWDAGLFKAWMDNIPTGFNEVWTCFYHEPEDNAKKSGNVAGFISNYLNVWTQMEVARKAHPNAKKVKFVKILMNYQEVDVKQAGCTWKEFHGGQSFVDAIGFDVYSQRKDAYPDPAKFFAEMEAAGQGTGLPVCVPEFGLALINGDTGAGRAAALKKISDYASSKGFLWVNYWCALNQDGSSYWSLEKDAASLAAWRSAMSH